MPTELMKSLETQLRPLWLFVIAGLAVTTVSRLGLMLWQSDRIHGLNEALTVLGFGLRIDLSLLCYWLAPVVLCLLVVPQRWIDCLVRVWLVTGLTLITFMEAATPGFIAQYDLRPNRLFVEYLQYPDEVLGMLLGGFLPELIFALAVLALAPWAGWRLFRRFLPLPPPPLAWWKQLLVYTPVVMLVVLGGRGTLGHRPINPSFTAFSADALVNGLTLNSSYSVAHAINAMRNEIDATALYPNLPDEEVFAEVRRAMHLPEKAFTSSKYPTLHRQTPSTRTPRYRNLVIVLEESLGAQFVGALGGRPLTPELDKLAEQGWLLEQLYATGTRSVRGIEAVVTGFVPTPARSVVKLPRSERGFFTLASLLGARGYDTSFIYGGEGHFDNMASFFLGNGFQRVVDQRSYQNPKFKGSWGVSDGDLFDKADEEFDRLHETGQPFFSLVFSSSNHSPYDYPVGEFTPVEQPANTPSNAIRYADHALGEFFRAARDSAYWNDTLFLVVADHDDRVYGASLIPIEHFRIPGLLLGKGMAIKRDPRLFSQLDLPPTLLSLLGIEAEHPMLGQDMTRLKDDYVGRAIMQYDQNQGYWRGDQVVVMQPHKDPQTFRLTLPSTVLHPAPASTSLVKEALAHALWGGIAYKRALYPGSQ